MDIFTILQQSPAVLDQSARIAENDPHGVIISFTSISIVFISLVVLYLAYELIGLIVNRWFIKKKDGSFSVEDNRHEQRKDIHDKESYAITINRKGGPIQKTVDRGARINSAAASDEDVVAQISRATSGSNGVVRAPLPGTILKVQIKEGDKVEMGQAVAVLEAMKMENTIEAERSGTVIKIHVTQGDSVLEGSEIMTIE